MEFEEETTSSASSPARPGRGRGRGKEQGLTGRRGRGRSRSGSRGRSRSRGRGRGRSSSGSRHEEEAARVQQLLDDRDESLRHEVENMDEGQLRRLCLSVVAKHPGIVFDILRPSSQAGGYHPHPGSSVPDWCVCQKCREMPTALERKCCGKEKCISLLPNFQILVLEEEVLAIARLMRRDILVIDDESDLNKANRHQAYRQFILWQHGRLGTGDRRVIPSCSVWAIRDKYPDAFGQYTGFIPSRFG